MAAVMEGGGRKGSKDDRYNSFEIQTTSHYNGNIKLEPLEIIIRDLKKDGPKEDGEKLSHAAF